MDNIHNRMRPGYVTLFRELAFFQKHVKLGVYGNHSLPNSIFSEQNCICPVAYNQNYNIMGK